MEESFNDLLGRNKSTKFSPIVVNSEGESISEANSIASAFNDYLTELPSTKYIFPTSPRASQFVIPRSNYSSGSVLCD